MVSRRIRTGASHSLRTKPFFGYFVVFALIVTTFGPVSFGHSCAGIFYPYAAADLGCKTGVLSYFTPLACLSGLVFLPFAGKLLNRCDARACLALSCAVTATAFLLISFSTQLWHYLACGVLMGFGTCTLIYLAPATLINRWFAQRAGFFIGLVMAFTGVGGMVWAAAGGVMIASMGWQWTYRVFSILTFACVPVMLACVASRPSDKGLAPYGDGPVCRGSAGASDGSGGTRASQAVGAPASEAPLEPGEHPLSRRGISAKRAFRMPQFYLIALMCFCLNFGMYLNGMIPSYMSTLTVGAALPMLGSLATSLSMAAQTATKLGLGAAGEKHPFSGASVCSACGIAGVALILAGAAGEGSAAILCIAAILYGVYYGVTNVMTPILARKTFGGLEYPVIYARISMFANVAGVCSGFIWGAVIDFAGFEAAFIGAAVFIAAAIACVAGVAAFQRRDAERFAAGRAHDSRTPHP